MPEQRSGLLPANATALERALEGVGARLLDAPVPIGDLMSPQRCPEAALPWLAWALGVEDWDSGWPVDFKRRLIAGAVEVHRRKGTPAAVKRLLDAIGAVYDYTEPAPLRFAVTIHNSDALPIDSLAGLRAAIDRAKRLSAHYTLTLATGFCGALPIAGGVGAATVVELNMEMEAV